MKNWDKRFDADLLGVFITNTTNIMAKENQTPNITSDTAVMLEGQMPEGQSTDTSSWGNKVRMGTLALMTALTPSATTTTITLGGVGLVTTMTSCGEDDPTPVDPNAIDRTSDNPAHKAEFLRNTSKTIWDWAIQIKYDAQWDGNDYIMILKEVIFDFDKGVNILKTFASDWNIDWLKLVYNFSDNKNIRINWVIPAAILAEWGQRDIMSSDYDKYLIKTELTIGGKNTTFSKGASWYLSLRVFNNNWLLWDVAVVNPYYIGK